MNVVAERQSPIVYAQVSVEGAFQLLEPIAKQLREGKQINDIDFGREVTVLDKVRICHALERMVQLADLLQNGEVTIELPAFMVSDQIN